MKSAIVLGILVLAQSEWAAATSCEKLAKPTLPHTEITEARLISKRTFPPPPGRGGGGPNPLYTNLPAICRVTATLRPTSDSDIKIEVWLPDEGWNGRLEAVGNGAFHSNILFNNLAEAVIAGYATPATNTGHEGNTGEFAFGHPEKLLDWRYRAVHEMTVTAKVHPRLQKIRYRNCELQYKGLAQE
jgi:feruloyl esterase